VGRNNFTTDLIRKKSVIPASGGNPKPIGGERKVQLIIFTYLDKPQVPVGAKHSGRYFSVKNLSLLPECFALPL